MDFVAFAYFCYSWFQFCSPFLRNQCNLFGCQTFIHQTRKFTDIHRTAFVSTPCRAITTVGAVDFCDKHCNWQEILFFWCSCRWDASTVKTNWWRANAKCIFTTQETTWSWHDQWLIRESSTWEEGSSCQHQPRCSEYCKFEINIAFFVLFFWAVCWLGS